MTGLNETSILSLEAVDAFISKYGSFDQAYAFRGFASPDVQVVLERWNVNRCPCDICHRSTQLSELKTLKVCSACNPVPKDTPPPPSSVPSLDLGGLDLSAVIS